MPTPPFSNEFRRVMKAAEPHDLAAFTFYEQSNSASALIAFLAAPCAPAGEFQERKFARVLLSL